MSFFKKIVVQWPHVFEIVIRLVETLHEFREQKSNARLEKHHGTSPDNLVAVVPIFPDELDAHRQNSQGIQHAIDKPLAGRLFFQGLAQGVKKGNQPRICCAIGTLAQIMGHKIEHHIKARNQHCADHTPQPAIGNGLEPKLVVFDACGQARISVPGIEQNAAYSGRQGQDQQSK